MNIGQKKIKFLNLHTPMLMFGGIWLFIYMIYLLNIYEIDRIHGFTWLLLLSSNIVVILGFYIPYHIGGFGQLHYSSHEQTMIRFDTAKLRFLVSLLFILSFGASFISTYLRAIDVGGILPYISNPWMARHMTVEQAKEATVDWKYYESILAFLKNFNFIGALLGGILFATSRKYRYLAFLPLLVGIFESFATFTRRFILENSFIWLGAAFYASVYLPEERKKETISALMKFILIFVTLTASYFVMVVTFRSNILIRHFGQTGKIIDFVGRNIYSYMVGNLVMLDHYLMSDPPFYHGVALLKNLFKWFNIMGIYDDPRIVPYIFWPFDFFKTRHLNMNTYTYVRILYEDFGVAGLMLLSFTLGLITYKLLVSYLKNFSLVKLYILSILCYNLFISFFDFYIRKTIVPIYCSLLLIVIQRNMKIFSQERAK